jgi:hypothetical protein
LAVDESEHQELLAGLVRLRILHHAVQEDSCPPLSFGCLRCLSQAFSQASLN